MTALLLLLALPAQDVRERALRHLAQAEGALDGQGQELFLPLGIARAKAGDRAGAERLFRKAVQADPAAAVEVAVLRARLGDLHGALLLAETLGDGWIRDGSGVVPGSLRTQALERIIDLLIEARRWDDAVDLARRLPDNDRDGRQAGQTVRREVLSKIAAAQARAGEVVAAAALLPEIGDAWLLDPVTAEIVRAWARRGEKDQALRGAELLTHTARIDVLFELAENFGVTAALARARSLIAPDVWRRGPSRYVAGLARLAVVLAKTGDAPGSTAALREAVAAATEDDLLVIALARLELESFDAAVTTARSITDPWLTSGALLALARRAPTCDQALALARRSATFGRADAAGLLLELGDLPAAIRAVEMLLPRWEEGDLPRRIVRAQIQAGDLAGAADTLKRLFRSPNWLAARWELDLARARRGEDPSALFGADADAILDARAEGFIARGDLEAAREAVARIERPDVVRRAVRRLPEKIAVDLAATKPAVWKAAAHLGLAEALLDR